MRLSSLALALAAAALVTLAACSGSSERPEANTAANPEPVAAPAAPAPEPAPVPKATPAPPAERAGDAIMDMLAETTVSKDRELHGRQRYNRALPPMAMKTQGNFTGYYQDQGRERYPEMEDNGVCWADQEPISTFAVDVDTAAYANLRRQLNAGQLPEPDSVRVEELVNYFSYGYPRSMAKQTPFAIYTEMGPSPWHGDRHLVHIGINGWQPDTTTLPPSNLVFLIDVSGSMNNPNKLPLLKSAMKLMVKQLRPEDSVAIVVYAGAAGQVLAPTAGDKQATIFDAIDRLQAGGSTNGEAGIRLAYSLARQNFKAGGVNRVMLATDGDFNVGTANPRELERLVERQRKSGVALSVLGFGTGNYNDTLMQKIAQIGNGNAAYIDTLNEARKVLVEELGATLNIIAKDTKVQVHFNPAVVDTYRLIGYETRHLEREDFDNDKVDAGDIGAGHTVTALYEITLRGEGTPMAEPLRYETPKRYDASKTDEIAFVRLRYKDPDASTSKLIEQPLRVSDLKRRLRDTSDAYRFASAVAWLGQHLRSSKYVSDELNGLIDLARGSRGPDPHGYRAEFINLAQTVDALTATTVSSTDAPTDNGAG